MTGLAGNGGTCESSRRRYLVELATKQRKKLVRNGRLKRQARRQLHQQAAELFSQAGNFVQESLQQLARTFQPLLVRDGLGDLHAEPETPRHARRPVLIRAAAMGPVERRVDLHRGKASGVALQVRSVRWKL